MRVERLLRRVTADPAFADQVKAGPKAVFRSVGVEPTTEMLQAIAESGDGEALTVRISRLDKGKSEEMWGVDG